MKRRSFLRNSAAASAVLILRPQTVFGSRANSAVRVGIIGCGNRGRTVISSMSKHTNTQIIAAADLFEDKLTSLVPELNKMNMQKGYTAIDATHTFKGTHAYQKLSENKDVDAVLITSPAYTHPDFVEAAVAAGKHVYCEKPVATDVAGCQRIQKVGEGLNGKLSMVVGFQIRYATPYVEMMNRIQQGAIGDILTVQLHYLSSGSAIHDLKNVSDDEFRIRNHYHFQALSGGILLDQGIHMLDVCNWVLKAQPIGAVGRGGNKGRPPLGDVWSNYQVLYQYPDNINVSLHTTKAGVTFGDVCCRFSGTKGIAEAHYSGGVFINGENKWDSGISKSDGELTAQQRTSGVFLSSLSDADANKEKAFINSIETGKHLNEAASGAGSTLTAILGRESALNHKELSWIDMLHSSRLLDPRLNMKQFD